MRYSSELRRCLEQCDTAGIRRLWSEAAPHLPQPKDDQEALTRIHYARTAAASITLRLRAYSHRWLLDNGYPSGLPDELKPRAERMYPVVVGAVGIAVASRSGARAPLALAIRGAMENAVLETIADRVTDPVVVRGRMMLARDRMLSDAGVRSGPASLTSGR